MKIDLTEYQGKGSPFALCFDHLNASSNEGCFTLGDNITVVKKNHCEDCLAEA